MITYISKKNTGPSSVSLSKGQAFINLFFNVH